MYTSCTPYTDIFSSVSKEGLSRCSAELGKQTRKCVIFFLQPIHSLVYEYMLAMNRNTIAYELVPSSSQQTWRPN